MFDWIAGVIERLGYWGIAGLTILENIVLPLPSEVIVPMAGFVSSRGELNFWLVVAAASAGAIVGTTGWYVVARSIGNRRLRAWVDAHGHWVTLSCDDIDTAQSWFDKYGVWAVFVGRLVPGVRALVSIPAGFAGMPFGPFLLYTSIGTIIWTVSLAWAGTMLESNFDVIGHYVERATNVGLIAFAAYLAWRYVRVFRARSAGR
jgi:membrane protein DedA with SNARE-associated domain